MNIIKPLYRRKYNLYFILKILLGFFIFVMFCIYPVYYRSQVISTKFYNPRLNNVQLISVPNDIQFKHNKHHCLSEPKKNFDSIVVHGNLGTIKTKDNGLINCYIASMITKNSKKNKTILLKEYKNKSDIIAFRQKEAESILKMKSIYPFIDCWTSPKIVCVENQTILYDISCLWSLESLDVIQNVLMNYYYYPQDTNNPILFFNPNYFLTQREKFIKKTIYELICSISYMHQCNIIHNNIDKNCIILKTLKDTEYQKQEIKLTRFDESIDISNISRLFIRNLDLPNQTSIQDNFIKNRTLLDNILNPKKKQNNVKKINLKDYQYQLLQNEYRNIGLVISEFIFSSFSLDGPSPRVSKSLLEKRFIFNDFDMKKFRSFCMRDENNRLVIEILDKDNWAGWDFLDTIFNLKQNLSVILEHRFFDN